MASGYGYVYDGSKAVGAVKYELEGVPDKTTAETFTRKDILEGITDVSGVLTADSEAEQLERGERYVLRTDEGQECDFLVRDVYDGIVTTYSILIRGDWRPVGK